MYISARHLIRSSPMTPEKGCKNVWSPWLKQWLTRQFSTPMDIVAATICFLMAWDSTSLTFVQFPSLGLFIDLFISWPVIVSLDE